LPEGGERLRSIPQRFRARLADVAQGALPPNVALMHVLMEAADAEEVGAVLAAACGAFRGDPEALARLRELACLHDRHPEAFGLVKGVLARIVHDQTPEAPADGVQALAAAFDRAVSTAPEASVALYALGSPELLREATAEVVEALRKWGLLGSGRTMLEIGCGIGRFEVALAPEVRLAVGIDVSAAMLGEARRRCAGAANAAFLRTSGLDLAAFVDGSFDLILAVDSFPYLVQAGPGLAGRHIEEAARVLKSGGDLLILNFSYRGDLGRDRAEIAAAAQGKFRLIRAGERPFRLWDGAAFHLTKPPAEPT
jgi:SAM-dependent methyltransferase